MILIWWKRSKLLSIRLTNLRLQSRWNKAMLHSSTHSYFDYFEKEYTKDFKLSQFDDQNIDEDLNYLSENEISWQVHE